MTDLHSGFVVTLAQDLRADDAEAVLLAISMIKGVQSIDPIPAQAPEAFIVEQRLNRRWRTVLEDLAQRGPGHV